MAKKAEPAVKKIVPVGQRVLVKTDPKTSMSEGGIQLPHQIASETGLEWGVITALSHTPNDKKFGAFAVGDRIQFTGFSAHRITDSEDSERLVSLSDIVAIEK